MKAAGMAAFALAVAVLAEALPAPATYRVRMLRMTPPTLAVSAHLPIDGQSLEMETEHPSDIPELDARGWPALISNLRVSDATGGPVPVTAAGKAGWQLSEPRAGWLTVNYEVDYSALAGRGWPAPREAAWGDANDFVFIGRSVFVTTRATGSSLVTFDLPRSWRVAAPWEPRAGPEQEFAVAAAGDLVENLVAFSRSDPDVITAGGFRLLVVPLGHWRPARSEVRRVLSAVVPRLVRLMGFEERAGYLLVLLPVVERGGESFRSSFALTVDAPPSSATRSDWGNLLAHEIFHFWNGRRLRGADYASSQWFQEGFTEYVANVSMVGAGFIGPDEFIQKLSGHVLNYRKLTTTLEAIGTHKGPPLYSAGALVAFSWDVRIRQTTGGRRNLGDFQRAFWKQTDASRRPYEWRDILAALDATAKADWDSFYRSYVRGTQPLPLDEILALVGLRLVPGEGATPLIQPDPGASPPSRQLWRSLLSGF